MITPLHLLSSLLLLIRDPSFRLRDRGLTLLMTLSLSGTLSSSLVGCVIKESASSDMMSSTTAEAGREATPEDGLPSPLMDDEDGDGFTEAQGDCDDTRFDVNPSRRELCGDGVDQDCDGTDQDCATIDRDGDGFSERDGDCDDDAFSVYPGRLETCGDEIDQDCDGVDLSCEAVDEDGDGYSPLDGDCAEGDSRRSPNAVELCGDGIDQDCDGEDLSCDRRDEDNDGVFDDRDLCPLTFDPNNLDSDGDGVGDACDNCPSVPNLGQEDQDGNGRGDLCDQDVDQDGDGLTSRQGDCVDDDPNIYLNAPESCDELDNDCDGFIDNGCPSDLRSPVVEFSAGESLLGSTLADPNLCRGDPRSDENCDEVPQKRITLSAFAIEVHEVTHAQYQWCIERGRCAPPRRVEGIESSQRFGQPAYVDHPVTWIDQAQASAYCRWIGGRLPTEAQWERAARGDMPFVDRSYLRGDDAPTCAEAHITHCVDDAQAVMSVEGDRTAQGVYDLIGNVHELTDGYYDPRLYANTPTEDPEAPTSPVDRDQVSVRGGSYRSAAAFSTITYRGFRLLMERQRALPEVGFRCAFSRDP